MEDAATVRQFLRKQVALFVVIVTLSARPVLAQTVGPNVTVGPNSEGSIAINPADPTNSVAVANFGFFYSLDTAQTWANSSTTSLGIFADDSAAFDTAGNAYLVGLQFPAMCSPSYPQCRGIHLWESIDKGQTYPASLASWVLDDPAAESDQSYMAIDTQPTSPFKDNIYVVWSEYGAPALGNTPVGFQLLFARSTDHGATFSTPIDISDSCAYQEQSSYINTGPNGEIYVVWIGCGSVMFDKSLDGGLTWGVDKVVRTVAPRTNNFPLTDDVRGNPTVVADRSSSRFRGRIYVSSIDTNASFGGVQGAADAWVVHSADGGNTWSSPVLLSNGPRGAYKYYFQPRISVSPGGRLDAAWYDTRFNASTDTNNVTYDVFSTYSVNGGVSVKPSLRVTNVSSHKVTHCCNPGQCGQAICQNGTNACNPCGTDADCPGGGTCQGQRILYEYMGLASASTEAHPLWTDCRTGCDSASTPTAQQFTATISQLKK